MLAPGANCRLEALLEPRVYRAAFIPALLALVIAAFSLESRPRPLPQGLAADIPLEDDTETTLRAIVESHPDRRPGKTGNRATAALVRDEFRDARLPRQDRPLQPGQQRPRERRRSAGGANAPAGRDRRAARRELGAGRPRERGRHRRPARAGARFRGAPVEQDARARLDRRLHPGRAWRRAAGRRPRRPRCRRRGDRDLEPGRPLDRRVADRALVERLAAGRDRPGAHRRELPAPGARPARRRSRDGGPAGSAQLPGGHRRPGRPARTRLRRRADLGQRRAAGCRRRVGGRRRGAAGRARPGHAADRDRGGPGPGARARAGQLRDGRRARSCRAGCWRPCR